MCIALKYGIWNTQPLEAGAVNALVSGGYPPLPAMVLASRGLTDPQKAAAYLCCDAELYDPFLMTDMDKAVARVQRAIDRGEKIAVFGDYDVDGITSSCMLTDFLRRRGGNCVSSLAGVSFVCAAEYIWFYPRVLFAFFILIGATLAAVKLAEESL